jgi:predicted esterase
MCPLIIPDSGRRMNDMTQHIDGRPVRSSMRRTLAGLLALSALVGQLQACANADLLDRYSNRALEDAGGENTPEIGPGPQPLPPGKEGAGGVPGEGGGDDPEALEPDADDPVGPGGPPTEAPPEEGDADTEEPPGEPEEPEGGGGAVPTAPPPPPVVCTPIIEGLSTVVVNGTPRLFNVQFPADRSRMALLFLWHGFLEIPTTFAGEVVYDPPAGRWRAFNPNAFPMPLMIVTPFDTKILPPAGLDWDIVSGEADLPYFDAMMQCIREQFSIDEARIYSFGFSAGAVFSNLLAALRPQQFAATISESGAWFNDQAQWADVLVPIIQWRWPAFNPADGGNILLTHGGPNDFSVVISLESANEKAMPFLYNSGRTVTECEHGFGHTRAPDLTEAMYYEWMWAHWRGGPPIGGLPPSFPVWPDRIIGSTFCTFHPAP